MLYSLSFTTQNLWTATFDYKFHEHCLRFLSHQIAHVFNFYQAIRILPNDSKAKFANEDYEVDLIKLAEALCSQSHDKIT